MRRAVVLWNPRAGLNNVREADIRGAFARARIDLDLRRVRGQALAAEAERASRAPEDLVVAAGGDGTVNAVAGVMVAANKPMGVLPLGTLNHFAKDTGLPTTLDEAAHALAGGQEKAVDVGEVSGHIFLNNSSLGLYPRIIRDREEQRLKLGRNRWVALFLATLSVFRRFPTLRVRIETAQKTEHVETPLLFVGNNEYEIDLLSLGRRGRLDRGYLCLYLVKSRSRFGVIRLALRSLFGGLKQDRDFSAQRLTEFWVESRRRHLDVALDGEVVRLRPPLHYRSRPGALRLIGMP